MTTPLIWLAAFPKSGSTWLRFLLHHLLHGPPERSRDVDARVPSIHDEDVSLWQRAVIGGGVVLTHRERASHAERYRAGAGFIQMVRHPADVVLSDAHFFALTQLDRKIETDADHRPVGQVMNELALMYVQTVLRVGKVPKQDRLGMGTWSENVESWLACRNQQPSVLVRFEDLRANPVAELERVCRFLRLQRSPEQLAAAAAGADVVEMKAMQEREIREQIPGRFYNPRHATAYRAGLRFVRKGAVGQRDLLQGVVGERLHQLFGGTMVRLGYTLGASGSVAGALDPELRAFRVIQREP